MTYTAQLITRPRQAKDEEPAISSSRRGWKPAFKKPFYGWAVVIVAALIAFSSGPGQSFTFSVFLDSIIEDTGLTRTTISAIYAVGTGVSAMMVMIVSRLADRFGPRMMVSLVTFALGLVCFGMAFAAGTFAFFIVFAALRALGQGSMSINGTLLTAQWFVRRRGRAMAVMGLGFAASNAMLPPLSRSLIDSFGWREAYMVLGVLVWVLVIPAALLVVRDSPEQMGLYPDGAARPPVGERQPASTGKQREKDTRKVFTSPLFWLLAVPLSTSSFVSTALIFHQTSIFDQQGLSPEIAAVIFVPMAVTSAVVSTISGFLIDRVGPKSLFVVNMAILLGATVMVAFIAGPLGAVLYAVVLGATSGISRIISSVTWAHIYGRHGLGRVQGAAMMVSISAAALGPLPLSALRQDSGSYAYGLAAMAALPVLSVIMISFARPQPVEYRPSPAVD